MSLKVRKYLQNRSKTIYFKPDLTQFSLQIGAEAGPNRPILSGMNETNGTIGTLTKSCQHNNQTDCVNWGTPPLSSSFVFQYKIFWAFPPLVETAVRLGDLSR